MKEKLLDSNHEFISQTKKFNELEKVNINLKKILDEEILNATNKQKDHDKIFEESNSLWNSFQLTKKENGNFQTIINELKNDKTKFINNINNLNK